MSLYKEYPGLDGGTIRVHEDTIASAPYTHRFPTYPLALLADRLGDKRDKFANWTIRARWIEDAVAPPEYRRTLARAVRG